MQHVLWTWGEGGVEISRIVWIGDYKPVEYWDTILTLQSQGMAFVNEFSNVSYKMNLFGSHRSFRNKVSG